MSTPTKTTKQSLQVNRPSKSAKIGLRELSRRIGVSTATVSHAINRPHLVKPKTRKIVLDAVSKAGYVPNQIAKSLKTQRTLQLGIVAPTLSNTLYTDIVSRAQVTASKHGFDLVLNSAENWSIKNEIDACRRLMSLQVAGVVLIRRADLAHEQHLRAMLGQNMKVVLLAERTAMIEGMSCINVDQRAGAYAAVEHLLAQGHRRFMMTGYGKSDSAEHDHAPDQRELGLRAAVRDAGLACDSVEYLACQSESAQSAYEAIQKRLTRGKMPTALLGSNDQVAVAVMAALLDAGGRVPEDFSVIGFDNTESSRFVRPALTTVSQSHLDTGARAVEMLLNAIAHPQAPPQFVTLQPELLIRGSTGPCHQVAN